MDFLQKLSNQSYSRQRLTAGDGGEGNLYGPTFGQGERQYIGRAVLPRKPPVERLHGSVADKDHRKTLGDGQPRRKSDEEATQLLRGRRQLPLPIEHSDSRLLALQLAAY